MTDRKPPVGLLVGLTCTVFFGSIGCKPKRPGWAKYTESGIGGDGTVQNEPAPVRRFSAPPVIDGKLDDAAWEHAAILGPFVEPGSGKPASSKSVVAAFMRIGWDDEKLYLGVVISDIAPFSPFGRDDVDPHIWERSSAMELMLQPGDPGDNRDYYEIQVDSAGSVFDTHWDDYNTPIVGDTPATKKFGHMEWSSKVDRAIHLDGKTGFYAIEVAMPWSSLEHARVVVPPHAGDIWRANVYSFRDGQHQALAWSAIRGKGNFHRSSRFGRIRFDH